MNDHTTVRIALTAKLQADVEKLGLKRKIKQSALLRELLKAGVKRKIKSMPMGARALTRDGKILRIDSALHQALKERSTELAMSLGDFSVAVIAAELES